MPKSTSHTTTAVILFSILTIVLEFAAYYFFKHSPATFIITGLMALIITHVVLSLSYQFEACFSYQLLHVLIWGIVLFLLHTGNGSDFITFSPLLFLFPAIHWGICVLYCIFRNLMDESTRFTNFRGYFIGSSIVFLLLYSVFLCFWLFLNNTDSSYQSDLKAVNFVPFLTLAGFITDFLDKELTLSQIFSFLADKILVYLPYGFFIVLTARRNTRLVRFALLLLFPVAAEILQRVLLLGKGDLEDVLYGLLGGLAGGLCYHLLNRIYDDHKGEIFLENHRRRSYSSSLRF
ncbi:VanZ family protein [Anaerocolumna sp. AGMB13020]|uniref:VanZ family protein n=1 Tax=Anaerocolumna sp. AGMB13020 TaxID=3081750 RepID=UPI002953A4A1|nr:VanZ family protein [Anaerocolumna sp. AGMB13020]WOO35244.1 VanZ family protein [Anaerocolumna sp. AGMB13020]